MSQREAPDVPHVRLGRHHELVIQQCLHGRLVLEQTRRRMDVHRLVGFERPI